MLVIALVTVALVVAILAIPLEMTVNAGWPQHASYSAEVRWAFGLVRVRLGKDHDAKDEDKKSTSNRLATATTSSNTRSRSGNPAAVWRAVRIRAFRHRVCRLLRDLWCSVDKEYIRLDGRIGLGDPASTGQLWSAVGPATAMLRQSENTTICIEPEFLNQVLTVGMDARVRMIPLQIVWLIIGFCLSPVVWRGFNEMRAKA